MMWWQLVPFGEYGLHSPAGCDGEANDRDKVSVLHKQSNLVRAEVIMLGPWLYRQWCFAHAVPLPGALPHAGVSHCASLRQQECQCLRILNACVIFCA